MPAIQSGSWNDDTAPRAALHGAFQVLEQRATAGLPSSRMLFVHRAGYLVLQDRELQLHPYELFVDTAAHRIGLGSKAQQQLFRYEQASDSMLTLYSDTIRVLSAKAVNWRGLPALH